MDDEIIDHEKTLLLKVEMLQQQVDELQKQVTDLMNIIVQQPFALGHTVHKWYNLSND